MVAEEVWAVKPWRGIGDARVWFVVSLRWFEIGHGLPWLITVVVLLGEWVLEMGLWK